MMEGYFNFGFSNSVRKPSTWFNKTSESSYRIDIEWNCDAVERGDESIDAADTVDTDLDSDSFLSDLERDSGETQSSRDNNNHNNNSNNSRYYSHQDWNTALEKRSCDHSLNHNNCVVNDVSDVTSSITSPSQLTSSTTSQHINNKPDNDDSLPKHEARRSVESSPGCCFMMTRLDVACILGLVSLSSLIFSLIAPHWLVTTSQRSSFVRLNPWDLCVSSMMVISQFSSDNLTLTGCYNVWSHQLQSGGERLVQDWFIIVPATLLIASSLSLSARAVLFLIWFKKRQIFPLKLGTVAMCVCSVFDLMTGLLLLTSTITFAGAVLTSVWLPPTSSSLSWGWAACLSSSWCHVATAVIMARETYKEKHRRVKNESFIRNLGS